MITACDSSSDIKKNTKSCPKCNMEIQKSNIYTSTLTQDSKTEYFDDIGCMLLWIKDNSLHVEDLELKVFSKDTNRYIDAKKAFYKINENTPMRYGFSGYEQKQENSVNFNEVHMKMLRGEHMANPKIRKQILGN